MMAAVMTEYLVEVAKAARSAGHGGKQAIYQQACQELNISLATLHRKLNEVAAVKKSRKQRRDAGQSALSREEALMISGVMMESRRGNDKRLMSLSDALTALRSNNLVRAEHVDEESGEVRLLSESAVHRALRRYGLHPEQLSQPDPHTSLRSLHPNHVWQIDASLCVLYYLKPQAAQANGLHIMDQGEFYKNKPKNLARVMADRVWSYEITDHASGWIYVEYVMGAESGQNFTQVLINAMQERGGADVLHGVPKILYMDPGSANTSAMALNLCKSLGIEAIAHAPGNARATGQVENARNIIEKKFEAGLRFRPVADLSELNALAARWRAVFNAQQVHRRHGKSRSAQWLTIREDQLVKAPSVEVCRELAVATPEERKVTPGLKISFHGDEYCVGEVPNVLVGQKLLVTRNPWREDAAQVVIRGDDGHETFYLVPRVVKDELGFDTTAPVLGEGYGRLADTGAQKAKQAIEQVMTSTETPAQAEAVRKSKSTPLQGRLDPYKPLDDARLPDYMPRRGREHHLQAPTVVAQPLTHLQAAKVLRKQLGDHWQPEHFAWLQRSYPQGIPEDQLAKVAEQLRTPRPALKVVGGND
ncbi:DDE-type integrase/transposase/recombinase [Terasakiispira papahanaumokuakeensis]|nr:DDE-type integrase/transposase/recombinase [Terasakiispira papahanaumokuakeensis]